MKIFYIANARIPTEKAHGVQIMKMCEAFAKFGHEVKLIVPQRATHIADEAFAFYGMQPNFEIVYLPTVDLIRWSGWVPKVFSYLQNWTFGRSVKKYLKTNKPGLVHTRDELTALALPQICPIILEIHNTSRILKSQVSKLSKLAKIISITQGLKNELVRLGYDENRIQVLPDGVDLQMFHPPLAPPPGGGRLGGGGKKTILYTGNFFEWKGVYVLAEAAKEFDDNYQFVFVGGSPFEQEKFKKFINHKENIKLVGHVAHHLIPSYLAAANVLVLPNSAKSDISKYYTSPMKLFEYMAADKPIVASDLPSIREILNEENSILVRPDDPQALAEGIAKVMADQNLAERIAKQAYQDVQNYSWSKRAQRVLSGF